MKKLIWLFSLLLIFSSIALYESYGVAMSISRSGCFDGYKDGTSIPKCKDSASCTCYTWYDDGTTKEGDPCNVFVHTNLEDPVEGDGYINAEFIKYDNPIDWTEGIEFTTNQNTEYYDNFGAWDDRAREVLGLD